MSITGYIDFDRTKTALDFAAVLSFYNLPTHGTGDQLKISCPFHDPDDHPSCGVNVAKGAFHCFACHTKGNTLEFVALMQELDPEDMQQLKAAAVFGLETIMGLDPKDFRKAAAGRQKPQNARREAKPPQQGESAASGPKRPSTARTAPQTVSSKPDPAAPRRNDPIDVQLTLDPDHHFFSDHGISPEAVAVFGLGYCSRGLMKDRIAIPIHNASGELVAYAGRWAEPEVPQGTVRYKLPKHFHKSLELFNLHRAIELAAGGRHLTLVEGYWSAMRLHLLGISCVACFGSSVSPEQAALIRQSGFRYVTVLFDADAGGRAGLDQALPILGRQLYARALELPEGEKPDTVAESFFAALRPPQS